MTPRPPRPVSMTLNLAPMVDVMMCLIIFFLLGSRLVSESQPIDLAEARAAEKLARAEELTQVTINVTPARDGNGPGYAAAVGRGMATLQSLPAEGLAGFLQQRASDAGHPDRIRCVIRADRDAAYAAVEEVLRACGIAGVSRVVFGATPIGEGT